MLCLARVTIESKKFVFGRILLMIPSQFCFEHSVLINWASSGWGSRMLAMQSLIEESVIYWFSVPVSMPLERRTANEFEEISRLSGNQRHRQRQAWELVRAGEGHKACAYACSVMSQHIEWPQKGSYRSWKGGYAVQPWTCHFSISCWSEDEPGACLWSV